MRTEGPDPLIVKVVADIIAAHEAYAASPPPRIVLPERLFAALIRSAQKNALRWSDVPQRVFVYGVEVVADAAPLPAEG